ncbi:MAG TPA: RHS repeat-associated core domain-containing protein, partial [Candidatus Saccharimonadales bacterium]|nr:RHS repeat-associated core domain-containing protein [Candidatus Saccharimonadales bacterium]
NPLGDGVNATSRYTWDALWDLPTQVVSPTGVTASAAYRTDYPAPTWQQYGSDAARRVSYAYDGSRQLAALLPPLVAAESLAYDALGNVQRLRSSLGLVTYTYGDAIGRDTLVVAPDSGRTRTWYSVMNRVDSTRWRGNAVTVPETGHMHPADSVTLTNTYDAEGNQIWASRRVGTAQLTSGWTWDDANRLTGESSPGGGARVYSLDPAGNVTWLSTPRGHTIRTDFDALNRPVRRVVPQVNYGQMNCLLYAPCFYTFPTRDGPDVCLAEDTATFGYDATGNLRRADNGWALVHRAYAPNGLLAYDTLIVRTYETHAPSPCGGGDRHAAGLNHNWPDFTHVYALQVSYDRDGRRTALAHPDAVDFCPSSRCITQYAYDAATGDLHTVTDPQGHVATFTYDALGRLVRTVHLSGASDTTGYDQDSRVTWRRDPFGVVDQLNRDALGRLSTGTNGTTSLVFRYGPLGALAFSQNATQGSGYEQFDTDPVGNRTWQQDYGIRANFPTWDDRQRTPYLNPATLQLDSMRWSGAGTPYALTGVSGLFYLALYDQAGNVGRTAGWEPYWAADHWAVRLNNAVNYYDAEDRLRVVNRHIGIGQLSETAGGVLEEYRYDALGRRVLVRSRCTANGLVEPLCRGYLERTVWDGDQVLYEIRSLGADSTSPVIMEMEGGGGSAPYDVMLGGVGYVHATGIDQPLGVFRMLMPGQSTVGVAPHANFLGDFAIGSWITGSYRGQATNACTQGYPDCPPITWPGGNITADGELTGGVAYATWFGNLLDQKTDGSRLQYMRHRYYDPQAGRFTQQDPIGLAGGLNLCGGAPWEALRECPHGTVPSRHDLTPR